MNRFPWLYFAVVLISCGTQTGTQGPAGPQGTPGIQGQQAPSQPPTDIQQLVAEQNAYRESVGQEDLIPGLNCALYTVPTSTTQITGASLIGLGNFEFNGVFNQLNESVTVGFNVLPINLEPVVQAWFIMKCYGDLIVSDNNWHEFTLSSDDGSNLYIDGLLINNDGLHGITTVSASKYLQYGFHSFELDFFQATGNQALILNEDGNVMGNEGWYH